MKTTKTVNITPQYVLLNHLQSLYYAEKIVKYNFDNGDLKFRTISDLAKIQIHFTRIDDTVIKLEKIFDYMLQEPQLRKNQIVHEFIKEYKALAANTTNSHLQDILLLNLLQNITDYKIINYKTAYLLAIIMQLDTVSDLIQQILEEEHDFKKIIEDMSLSEFNHVPQNN